MEKAELITGAELATLRESCGMSQSELGQLTGWAGPAVEDWEAGRSAVPGDVADLMIKIDTMIAESTAAALDDLEAVRAVASPQELSEDLVLLRYRTAEDLARYEPGMRTVPISVHGALIGRVRLTVQVRPKLKDTPVRIVWMEPDRYEAWRKACRLPDDGSTRTTWAAQQVQVQAQP